MDRADEIVDFINDIDVVSDENINNILLAVLPVIIDATTRKEYRKKRYWESEFVKTRRQGFYSSSAPSLLQNKALFRNYFRMTASQFEFLANLIGPCIARHRNISCRQSISINERLAMTLRYLAAGGSQVSLGYHYQVSKTTVCNTIYETCLALSYKLMPMLLAQPTTADWIEIAKTFESRWKFPHCIGAIDGTHIRIKAPSNSGSKYFNYKLFHSIILLAVCDAKYCFTLVDIGANGRQSDGGVFSRSNMGRRFENGSMEVPPPAAVTGTETVLPYVLVADQAFSLAPYLLRPYPDRSDLDSTKRIFNYRLSSVRRIIENSFGIMQARWQVFWGPIGGNIDTAKAIVSACVCLHNFLMKGDKASGRNFYFHPSLVDNESHDGEIVPGSWRNQIPMQIDGHSDDNSPATAEFPVQREEIRQRFAEFLEDEGAVPWQFWRMYL